MLFDYTFVTYEGIITFPGFVFVGVAQNPPEQQDSIKGSTVNTIQITGTINEQGY